MNVLFVFVACSGYTCAAKKHAPELSLALHGLLAILIGPQPTPAAVSGAPAAGVAHQRLLAIRVGGSHATPGQKGAEAQEIAAPMGVAIAGGRAWRALALVVRLATTLTADPRLIAVTLLGGPAAIAMGSAAKSQLSTPPRGAAIGSRQAARLLPPALAQAPPSANRRLGAVSVRGGHTMLVGHQRAPSFLAAHLGLATVRTGAWPAPSLHQRALPRVPAHFRAPTVAVAAHNALACLPVQCTLTPTPTIVLLAAGGVEGLLTRATGRAALAIHGTCP